MWGGLWVAQGALGWTRFPVGCLCPPPAFRSLQTPSPLYFQNKKGSEKGGLGGGGNLGLSQNKTNKGNKSIKYKKPHPNKTNRVDFSSIKVTLASGFGR